MVTPRSSPGRSATSPAPKAYGAGHVRCRPVPRKPLQSLYEALSGERNLSLDTVLRVAGALGLKLHAEAAFNSDAAEQGASAYR